MMAPTLRIHAVTVCNGYSDFLEHTARVNQNCFDNWIIVTTQEDKGTLAVCERYGLRVAYCPYFTRYGSSFNKALGINIGLAHMPMDLTRNGVKAEGVWICHIDADTALPEDFRKLINNIPLDTKSIYGVDRVECPNYEAWIKHRTEPDLYKKHYFCRPPDGWEIGSRLRHFDYGDYLPIGYFQLWHTDSGIYRYPTVQNAEAEHTDVLHALQWDEFHRHLIPSILVTHLKTGGNRMGQNWDGRKTPKFGPKEDIQKKNKVEPAKVEPAKVEPAKGDVNPWPGSNPNSSYPPWPEWPAWPPVPPVPPIPPVPPLPPLPPWPYDPTKNP